MERVELNKLNMKLYDLNFGPYTIPLMAQKMSKKRMLLNCKQYKHSIRENGDMQLQILKFIGQCPTVDEIIAIALDKYITLTANDCGYGDTSEEFFLKAKYATS